MRFIFHKLFRTFIIRNFFVLHCRNFSQYEILKIILRNIVRKPLIFNK